MSIRDTRGQAAVLSILFMTVLIGAAAIALDVGTWFHARRALQATADAAALAGAQALPESTADAQAAAIQYASKNGGVLAASGITFSDGVTPHDTISVHLTAPAPGFFSKMFGLNSVTVAANATARSDNIGEALHVAPIAVFYKHPMLQCTPLPCSDPTQIDLFNLNTAGAWNAPGAFGLIDLLQDDNGSAGATVLADWIQHGFDEFMQPGQFYSVPSAKFNSSQIVAAMQASIGQVLLFPIYDKLVGPGSNAQYHIIAWAGFYVTGFDASGNNGTVYGHFTRRISEGVQVSSGDNIPDYGARAVQLIN